MIHSLRDIRAFWDFREFYQANRLFSLEDKIACLKSRMGCHLEAKSPEELLEALEAWCLNGWDRIERFERIPAKGEIWRHFKGGRYMIDGVAMHTESGDPLVVYHRLDDPERLFARPLAMFLSPVDREKYPDAAQDARLVPER